jgi:hypothetical protein
MAINLKEHAVFIDRLQMDMVPLSVAEKALQEVVDNADVKLDQAMSLIEQSLTQINNTIDKND